MCENECRKGRRIGEIRKQNEICNEAGGTQKRNPWYKKASWMADGTIGVARIKQFVALLQPRAMSLTGIGSGLSPAVNAFRLVVYKYPMVPKGNSFRMP